MRKILAFLLILMLPVSCMGEILTVDPSAVQHGMSDTLYGLFFEDINHAADGGLYAELLQNRSFEYQELQTPSIHQHLTGWAFNTSSAGDGKVSIGTEAPLHKNNPTYLRIEAGCGYAFQNLGYGQSAFRGGIPVTEGSRYDLSLWLRNVEGAGEIRALLTTRSGEPLSEPVSFFPDGEWRKHTAVLTAAASSEEGCLTFELAKEGILEADMASLMPQDRVGADWPGGGVRRDLLEALRDLHPRFLRFPGGCVAEGSWVWENLYRWKDTVGPAEQRKENWNTWGYMQSYGLGFYEYFCLCEELGALPLPVVGSGVLCQAREPAEAPMDAEELAAWIQDVLDLAEFALGGADTAWGAVRAEMGHPKPFDLRFLAIGNENWANVYFDRYEKIRNAVREQYPDLTFVVANGPVAEGQLFNAGRSAILHRFPEDVADEHYYMDSEWFLKHTHRYDHYPRSTKVFVGEYAAHEPAVSGRRPNNLYSALCEAAYLTSLERNSDVVVMSCYAPLLARTGMDQWTPDLLWFDGSRILKTPNYYVQQMFASTLGDEVLESSLAGHGLYHVATRKADGRIYLKIVNVSGKEKDIHLILKEADVSADAAGIMLSGEKNAVNTYGQEKTAPVSISVSLAGGEGDVTLPGYAAVVITVLP